MEIQQVQNPEKRLFCIDCGSWGWEENGLWLENYDGDTYIGQVWICIDCLTKDEHLNDGEDDGLEYQPRRGVSEG